ncbi:MAG: TonB family protein [Acidobacteriota bacterium]
MNPHFKFFLTLGIRSKLRSAAILLLIYPIHVAAQQENQPQSSIGGPSRNINVAEQLERMRANAEEGDESAQYRLGLLYLNGALGMSKDYAEAEKWIRTSAEQGYSLAQINLGMMYLQGNGVSRNYAEAAKWFRVAAEKGQPEAEFRLGMMYLQGNGVSRNYAEAAKWFQSAADQDNTSAQCMLGSLYIEGWGIPKDYAQAYKWLTLSVTSPFGDQVLFGQKAKEMSASLTEKMTKQQMEEAQKLVAQWESEHSNRKGSGFYFRGGNGFKEPVLLKQSKPPYTEKARRAHAEGIVIIEGVVRKNGMVDIFKIIRSLGYGLDESAIRTITNEWRFKPATYEGKPVDYPVNIEVVFKLFDKKE